MNIIKKTLAFCLLTLSLAAITTVSVAAEAVAGLDETIVNIEKAMVEVNNGAFSEAHLHLKTARSSAEQVTGDSSIISEANASVIQGQIEAKKGNVKESLGHLNKALGLYKSL